MVSNWNSNSSEFDFTDSELLKIDASCVEIENELDRGGQGVVFKGKYNISDDRKENVVIKKYANSKNTMELLFYNKFKNENDMLVDFYGFFYDKANNLNIVLQEVPGVNLGRYLETKEIPDQEKYYIIMKICDFVIWLKENKFAHRDLKPENIMVITNNVKSSISLKILDFGVSKCNDTNFSSFGAKFTINYMAPELFEEEENSMLDLMELHRIRGSNKVDVWSIGCLLSFMMSGINPWNSPGKKLNGFQIQTNILAGLTFPIPPNINEEAKRIINLCTMNEPSKRINIDSLRQLVGELYNGNSIMEFELQMSNYA